MGSIYDLLATNPGVLNATSRRLPDGHYLCEVIMTKEGPPAARSGACFIIEFRVVSGPLAGQKFSTVPKLDKNPEAATRELVAFCAACEGKTLDNFTNAATGAIDGGTLAALIRRAFQETTGDGANAKPKNPYEGIRVFVRAEEKLTKANFKFVRHEFSPASATLAAQYGFAWPAPGTTTTPVASPAPSAPAPATPGAPAMPPAAPPSAPMAPPAPVMPPTPPAPPVAPSGPRPVETAPGWFYSVKFPGWYFAGAVDEPVAGTSYYDPATTTTHRY